MTAAAWARRYHADLLAQLETEAQEGWPDLEWPPATRPVIEERNRRTLELILMRIYDVMLADEQRHSELLAHNTRTVWQHTGQPKKAA